MPRLSSNGASPKILQVSEGLTYTLDLTKSGADRVVADTIKLNGEAIDPARTYRVAMNEFLAGGGDGFAALGQGTNKVVGAFALDLLNAYLAAHSTAAHRWPRRRRTGSRSSSNSLWTKGRCAYGPAALSRRLPHGPADPIRPTDRPDPAHRVGS